MTILSSFPPSVTATDIAAFLRTGGAPAVRALHRLRPERDLQTGAGNWNVRKGEKGSLVADKITRTETDEATGEESGEPKPRTRSGGNIPFMKGYTVFNVEQIEGLPAQYYATAEARLDPVQRVARADEFFAATAAKIRHGGNMAYYVVGSDHVQMPPFETFRDAESYYATLAHETCHWTRHPSRLDRDFGRKRYGDEARKETLGEIARSC